MQLHFSREKATKTSAYSEENEILYNNMYERLNSIFVVDEKLKYTCNNIQKVTNVYHIIKLSNKITLI